MQSSGLNNAVALVGRLLLAAIFIQAGWGKIGGYEGTAAYMAKAGVPGSLLPVVIAVELLGGLLIVIGWQTRLVAIGLAIFTVLAAYLFHMNFGDENFRKLALNAVLWTAKVEVPRTGVTFNVTNEELKERLDPKAQRGRGGN